MDRRKQIIDQSLESNKLEDDSNTEKKDKRFKTEEEKALTKKKNIDYIKEYNRKKLCKLYLNVPIEDKVIYDTQAKLSGLSLTAYFLKILHEDSKNFDPEEYEKALNANREEYMEAYENKTVLKKAREKKEQEREKIQATAIKEIEQYFNKPIDEIKKIDRVKFIMYKTDYFNEKGNIGNYCNALGISRAYCYTYKRKMTQNGQIPPKQEL